MIALDVSPDPVRAERRRRRGGAAAWWAAGAYAAATVAAALLGGLATGASDDDWYRQLEQPPWNPPDAVFSPVWTVLYVTIAVSGWWAWRRGAGAVPVAWWAAQIVANLAWSVVFFGLQRPGWGLAVIVVLLAAVAGTVVTHWRVERGAGLLLLPYLAWVAFAVTLNAGIVVLNA